MAIGIRTSQVNCSALATTVIGVAGETITAGQTIYLSDSTNSVYKRADISNVTNSIAGIAQCNAWLGQSFIFCTKDPSFAIGNAGGFDGGSIILAGSSPGTIDYIASGHTAEAYGGGLYLTVLGVINDQVNGRMNFSMVSTSVTTP